MLRKRLSYANVIASLALFIALGGVGYAASQLPNNSVGTPQLKANAVTSSKVKNGTLLSKDFKAGQIPAGAKGATGTPGPAGLTGPTGVAGATGATGAAGPLLTVLASGQTLTGYLMPWSQATLANELAAASASFQFPLSVAPTAHYITFGTANPAGCTGTPTEPAASPGHLCIYELAAPTNSTIRGINSPAGDGTSSRFGFAGWVRSTGAGQYFYRATWAVTAA
jgi:hypothetical protein